MGATSECNLCCFLCAFFVVVLSINVTLFFCFSGRLECSTENVGFCQENWAANPLIFFIPWKRPRRSSDDHKLCRTTAPPVVISFSVLISRTFWKEGPHLSDVPRLFSHLFLCSTSYMQQNFKQRLYLMYIIQQIYQYVSVGGKKQKKKLTVRVYIFRLSGTSSSFFDVMDSMEQWVKSLRWLKIKESFRQYCKSVRIFFFFYAQKSGRILWIQKWLENEMTLSRSDSFLNEKIKAKPTTLKLKLEQK